MNGLKNGPSMLSCADSHPPETNTTTAAPFAFSFGVKTSIVSAVPYDRPYTTSVCRVNVGASSASSGVQTSASSRSERRRFMAGDDTLLSHASRHRTRPDLPAADRPPGERDGAADRRRPHPPAHARRRDRRGHAGPDPHRRDDLLRG